LGWLISFACSFIVYLALCTVWPTKNQKLIREAGLQWEELGDAPIIAEDGTEIAEEGKVVRERSVPDDGEAVFQETYGANKDF
jgi:NCS1 family nucleobase:cation symporter-1